MVRVCSLTEDAWLVEDGVFSCTRDVASRNGAGPQTRRRSRRCCPLFMRRWPIACAHAASARYVAARSSRSCATAHASSERAAVASRDGGGGIGSVVQLQATPRASIHGGGSARRSSSTACCGVTPPPPPRAPRRVIALRPRVRRGAAGTAGAQRGRAAPARDAAGVHRTLRYEARRRRGEARPTGMRQAGLATAGGVRGGQRGATSMPPSHHALSMLKDGF
jgi:hypothetical protein